MGRTTGSMATRSYGAPALTEATLKSQMLLGRRYELPIAANDVYATRQPKP